MRNALWVSVVHLICGAFSEVSFSVGVLSVDENGVLELPTILCLDIFEP